MSLYQQIVSLRLVNLCQFCQYLPPGLVFTNICHYVLQCQYVYLDQFCQYVLLGLVYTSVNFTNMKH